MARLNTIPDSKIVLLPFLRLPGKKLFADYYELIKKPISLAEIKSRNTKSEYASLQDLYDDFLLMKDNALQYNERGSDIANAASLILRTVEDHIIEKTMGEEALAYMTKLEQNELRIMDELAKYKQGRNHMVAELFIDEPSKEEYPDYYNIISTPTSINTIKNQILYGRARTIDAFKEIVELMFTNAYKANEDGSQVVADAKSLQKSFNARLEKLLKTMPEEPKGYTRSAEKLLKGICPEETEDNEESEESVAETKKSTPVATPLKLRIKPPVKETPRIKLSLKARNREINDESEPTEATVEKEEPMNTTEAAEEPSETPEAQKILEHTPAVEKQDETPTNANLGEDPAQPEEKPQDGSDSQVAKQEDTKLKLGIEEADTTSDEIADSRNILRDPHNPGEALIKSIVVSSVIPITSKYHLQKSPPPPALLNLFQITVPASQKYTVQSFAFSLPSFHRTININSTINEILNSQYYDLVLSHNYRQVKAYSSSTSSPWADAATPITHKYEVNLSTGLNFLEVTVSTQPGRTTRHGVSDQDSSNETIEKISFWITRMKN